MKHQDDELDVFLDRQLSEIRGENPDAKSAQAAVDRVWDRIRDGVSAAQPAADCSQAEPASIRSCADFQAMLPEFLRGQIQGSRRLLLEDHLGECVPCRRKLKELRTQGTPPKTAAIGRSGWMYRSLGRLAAAAAIFVALLGLSFKTDVFSFETQGMIRIHSVQGELLRVTDTGTTRLAPGDTIQLNKGENLLTAKGSTASILLADDSSVEMRERTGLNVVERRSLIPGRNSNGEIKLDRGSIIVDASDQGSGHLFVDTDDCRVAVKGTVFAVNHGVKGSRVSVIEGEVHVTHGRGGNDVLLPGQQSTTRSSLGKVPVEDEIAWSGNLERHLALLREMRVLGREMDEAIRPDLRYETALLDLAPANTVIYAGLPNLATGVDDAYQILLQRVATNDVLRAWWDDAVAGQGIEDSLEQVITKIREHGEHLGEEIVLTLQMGSDGQIHDPLFLARVNRPEAFAQFVQDEIAALDPDHGLQIQLIQGQLPADMDRDADTLYMWLRDDLLAVSTRPDQLRTLNGADHKGSAFHTRLTGQYHDGVEWIAGVDIQTIFRLANDDARPVESLAQLGLLDAQHLIATRRQNGDKSENRADLMFDRPRREMAAWLAEPAAMGALDYVSPNANLVAGFVMKDLGVVVDELFEIMGSLDGEFHDELARIEYELGFDIQRDLAGPLGGEFVLAVDGPILPSPSWKLIFETYDPVRLQQTIEQIVERINTATAGTDFQGLTLDVQVGSATYFHIFAPDSPVGLHFVFDGHYLIAGPSQAVLDRALQIRDSGLSLVDSSSFRDLLPEGSEVNFSAVLYQDLGPVLGNLSTALGSISGTPEQQQMVEALGADTKPSLALVFGERDSISLVSSSEGGLFTSSLGSLMSFPAAIGMQESLLQSMQQEALTRGN